MSTLTLYGIWLSGPTYRGPCAVVEGAGARAAGFRKYEDVLPKQDAA